MRLLKVILVALVAVITVVAGLIAAAVLGIIGFLASRISRLLGGQRPQAAGAPTVGRRNRPAARDVIDVTATEVKSGPPELPR